MDREKRVYCIRRAGRPYYLRYVDDFGRRREVSSGTNDLRTARRKAAALEKELLGQTSVSRVTWSHFRERYEAEALPALSHASAGMFATAANSVEALIAPRRLADLDQKTLSGWVGKLQRSGLAAATVQTYWRTLRASLSWARWSGLIIEVPEIRLPRGKARKARGRAVTAEEFELVLAAVESVRPHDPDPWRRFLLGLWHSGLRVDELRRLSWEANAGVQLTEEFELPLIRLRKQKNRQETLQPITREFWLLCAARPRAGWVFALKGDEQMSAKRTVRILSAIGKASGVIADAVTGRTVSSHDFGRRAFITRMDGRLSLLDLQKWARHASPATTAAYYHHRDAIALARQLWPGAKQI